MGSAAKIPGSHKAEHIEQAEGLSGVGGLLHFLKSHRERSRNVLPYDYSVYLCIRYNLGPLVYRLESTE